MPVSADDVLGCRDFSAAKESYPHVIQRALQGGPPEAVFHEHWAPSAEFHSSLRAVIAQAATQVAAAAEAAAAAAEPAAAPEPPPQLRVEDVMGLPNFDTAKERYPKIFQVILPNGPPEGVFRDNWSPQAQYHDSLYKLIARGVATVADAEAQPPQQQEVEQLAGERVVLSRDSDGEFWGFLCSRRMKVLEVNRGSPAERSGLRKGVYVLQVETSMGTTVCMKAADAYGPPGIPDKSITLLINDTEPDQSKQAQAAASTPAPASTIEGPNGFRPHEWMCLRCNSRNWTRDYTPKILCFRCFAPKPDQDAPRVARPDDDMGYGDEGFSVAGSKRLHDETGADRVALDYLKRKKKQEEQRRGSAYDGFGKKEVFGGLQSAAARYVAAHQNAAARGTTRDLINQQRQKEHLPPI